MESLNSMLSLPPPLPLPESPSKSEEERLGEKYYEEVVRAPELKKLKYFSDIQKQLERTLKQKYDELGYRMVRELNAPGVYYKIVLKKDVAFEFNVIERSLMLSAILNDACFKDNVSPDVRMLDNNYRTKKINLLADLAIEKFKSMKKLI